MLSRRIARPLLASWFVTEGIDALRSPSPRAEQVRNTWGRLASRGHITQPPPVDQLITIARVHGAATVVAGIMLAIGRAPRLAACSLAVLTVPLAVMDAPMRDRRSGRGTADLAHRTGSFARDLSLIGGAALAALDSNGRPSIAWRVHNAAARRSKTAGSKHPSAD